MSKHLDMSACPRCGAPAVLVFVVGRICRLVCSACAVVFDRKAVVE